MHSLFVLILITSSEAKRGPYDLPLTQTDYKVFNNYENNEQAETVPQSVDFGHVYRNGYRNSSYNRQFDLENEVPESKYGEKLKEILKKTRQSKDLNLENQPLVFLSPRDEMLYYKNNKSNNDNDIASKNNVKSISRPIGYDFVQLLERNLANPLANRRNQQAYLEKYNKKLGRVGNKAKEPNVHRNSSDYFKGHTFFMKPNKNKLIWTTCDEFAKRAVFHPDDVVNTKWVPFYIWSTKEDRPPAIIHTFSYPTKKIVQFFKTTYAPYIRKLNWKEPKLLLKEARDVLLIAGDRRGLFYGIPKQEIPSGIRGMNVTLPLIKLRMKIHDPYLAMMFCDEKFAVIMAELGTEPQTDQNKRLEASTLKFRGKGNTAYRDLEGEALLQRIERMKKLEAVSKKTIQIPIPSGDVDVQVRH